MADVLDAKIEHTAELGKTSFGHNGEVYTNLRPYTTTGSGITGYRFDHGERKDPYLKVYFISDDGTYLSVWERGHGTEYLRFGASFDENPAQTLNDRFNSLNAKLDETVFHARLEAAVQAYEATGQPQEFEWRGNTYTNLHDPGKSVVDYRFDHGQGQEFKVFFFAEDGSYVSGWSRAGQKTHAHPDRTVTDNLYERLVEVDELLPLSYAVPLGLEEYLDILDDDPDGIHEFQIGGRDMVARLLDDGVYDYVLFTDVDYVNDITFGHGVVFSDDGTSFLISVGDDHQGIDMTYQWGWSPTNDNELGNLLYGNDLSDTLYGRVQAIEWDMDGTIELYETDELSGFLRVNAAINQAPGSDEIRIDVEGAGRGLFGYNALTTIDATVNHGHDGSEIQSINFTSEAYDLLGYGELSIIEGAIHQGSYSLSIETYDALGYNETVVVALVINERPGGYGVGLDIDIDSSSVSVECSANAQVSENLTVTSLDVNCSDDTIESDIEEIFDEALVDTFEILQDESLQGTLTLPDEYDIVDETAPEYVGAFAPVDNNDLFI